MAEKILHQGDGLSGRCFSPVGKLRRHNDHLRIVILRLKGKVLTVQIFSHALKIQPLISRQSEENRIRLASVVAVGNINAVMNVPVICRMQHIIQQKTPVFLRALRHRCLRRVRLKVRGRCLFWSGGCFHRLCRFFGCLFGSACLQSRLFCAAVLYLCACIGTGSGKKRNDCRPNNQLVSQILFFHSSSFHQEKPPSQSVNTHIMLPVFIVKLFRPVQKNQSVFGYIPKGLLLLLLGIPASRCYI